MFNDNTQIKDLTVSQFKELCMSLFPVAPSHDSRSDHFMLHGIKDVAEFLGCGKTKAWQLVNDQRYSKAVMRAGRQIVVDGDLFTKILRRNNGQCN